MYFDEQFRQLAMERFAGLLRDGGRLVCGTDWAWTTEARYTTLVKRGGAMVPVEFAFSLDNLTPIGVAAWYTLHADEREANMSAWEKAVEGADEKKLEKWASTIAHIGAHNAYHIGQMIYIRKLQGSWNPEKGVK